MIAEHQRIVLTTDIEEDGLRYGDIGTVISVHNGGEAYTVEFMTLTGRTIGVVTLLASQVRPVASNDMQQARPLAMAA